MLCLLAQHSWLIPKSYSRSTYRREGVKNANGLCSWSPSLFFFIISRFVKTKVILCQSIKIVNLFQNKTISSYIAQTSFWSNSMTHRMIVPIRPIKIIIDCSKAQLLFITYILAVWPLYVIFAVTFLILDLWMSTSLSKFTSKAEKREASSHAQVSFITEERPQLPPTSY